MQTVISLDVHSTANIAKMISDSALIYLFHNHNCYLDGYRRRSKTGCIAIIIYCDMRVTQHDTAITCTVNITTISILNNQLFSYLSGQTLLRRPRCRPGASDVGCGTHAPWIWTNNIHPSNYNYVKVIFLCNSFYMLNLFR